MIEGRLELLPSYERALKTRTTIRLHVGTAEVLGTIVLLEGKTLDPGQTSFVQFHLEEPVAVAPGDRYVIRLHSPVVTIGGGTLLGPSRFKLKPNRDWTIERLRGKEAGLTDLPRRVETTIAEGEAEGARESELIRLASLPRAELTSILEELVANDRVERVLPGPIYLHAQWMNGFRQRLLATLDTHHSRHPHRLFMEKLDLKNALRCPVSLFDHAVSGLIESRSVVQDADRLRRTEHEVVFEDHERELMERIETIYHEGAFQTPRRAELPDRLEARTDTVDRITGYLLETGTLVDLAENVLLPRDRLAEAEALLREEIAA